MSQDTSTKEIWPDSTSHSEWSRNKEEKVFSLLRRQGRSVDRRWSMAEAGVALGSRLSREEADGAIGGAAVYFPPQFKYSPYTGKSLLEGEESAIQTWLPPAGAQNLRFGLLRGGKLTDLSLRLDIDPNEPVSDPRRELPLPPHGRFRFFVAACGLKRSFLLALDWKNGSIYCWLPDASEWGEVHPSGESVYLGSESISDDIWNIDSVTLSGATAIFWPCDKGLAKVTVDPLTLTYDAKLVADGCCVSQPVIQGDKAYTLMRMSGEQGVSLVTCSINGAGAAEQLTGNVPDGEWHVAATPHDAIWFSQQGQVVASQKRQINAFFPWQPQGLKPEFKFGPPYCARDGRLWLQVLHPTGNDGEEGPGYVSLGRATYEWQQSSAARTLSGKSSMKVEQRLTDDPWVEPHVVSSAGHDNDEAIVPILESITDGTMLVLRAKHTDGIRRFFEITELIPAHFQIYGHGKESGFFQKRLREPWKTVAFAYDGFLFLYHPDMTAIPGWPLSSSSSNNR
ncbi:MAG TPA: hypothetical protein VFF81_03045 [Noviherbaspirillum sp.]|nr:hypothetical protein [Noviherbaspirillum sp.]